MLSFKNKNAIYYLREPLISEHFKNLFLKMRTFSGSRKGIPRITKLFEVPLILFGLVALNIFLFSSVSPIHSLYNLQYDQTLYYLIGRGIKYGKIPYVDLIDHKGIYLFMTYALAAFIGEWNHIGLFIVTVIINYITAVFAYKTSFVIISNLHDKKDIYGESKEIITDSVNRNISLLTSFAIIFLLNTCFLSVCGLDCETVIIPFIMAGFYMFLKYLFSGKSKHDLSNIFLYGVFVGVILFIKANAVLFFVSIALFLLVDLIIKKEYKNLLLNFVFGLLGVIVGLLPGIIYCVATGSFADMIEQTFVVNFKYIGTGFPGTKSIFDAFLHTYDRFKEFTLLAIASVFALVYLIKHKRVIIFYILSLIISIYAVFAACRPYTHYMILLLPYYVVLFIFLIIGIYKIFYKQKIFKVVFISIFVLLNILSYSLNLEIGQMNGFIQSSMANKVKKCCKTNFGKTKNKKVLVVGFAMYLYDALETLPNEKYFATPVVLRSDYSKPYDEMVKRVKKGDEALVITAYDRTMVLDDDGFKAEIADALYGQYEQIGKFSDFTQEIVVYKKIVSEEDE